MPASVSWVLAGLTVLCVDCRAAQFVGSWREYGLAGSALAASAVLEMWPPNENHPLLGGEQKPYISRERVPDWALGAAHLATLGAIRFGPGGQERVRYAHGYAMAVVLTQFSASLVKGIVGRRRPNYEAGRALGKTDHSKSFFSGHASTTFCLATYVTLYTWDETEKLPFRVGLPALLYGAATYAAWSRVVEHRHYPSDVLVGAAAGSAVAVGVHTWYEGMGRNAERATVAALPGRFALVVRF